MKALLLLDGYTLIKQLKLFLVFIVFYAGLSLYSGEFMLLGFSAMFLVLLPYYLMQFCETSRTDALLLLLPNDRNIIVRERYLTILLTLVPVGLLTLIIALVLNMESALLVLTECALGMAALSVIVPLAYKFGVAKSRMILIFAIAVLGASGGAMGSVLGDEAATLLSGNLFHAIALLSIPLALVVVFVSYRISLAIYSSSEF